MTDITNNLTQAIIEIPLNSFIKYEFDIQYNRMRCDRILNSSMIYPGNYGYIPNTIAKDGDPLDILVIADYPLYPGTIIECKILGVLIMSDEKGLDEKIIAIPSDDIDLNSSTINHYLDLPLHLLTKIKHFFKHYKDNDTTMWSKVEDFKDNIYALQLIDKYSLTESK